MRPPDGIKIDHADWEKENWQKKLYTNAAGQVIVPRKMTRAGLIAACKFTTLKPPGRLRSFSPLVKTCVVIEDDAKMEFDSKQLKAWGPEFPTRGKGKMPVFRPLIELPWAFGVTVNVYDDNLKRAVIDDLFEVFGRVCGLGEAREYMGYGRFESTVTEI
jgi:hypothetical protein